MENSQTVKIMHKGKAIRAAVVECYQVPVDFELNGQKIRKGSWWMSVRIQDDEIWKEVKSGNLKGFSMGGHAQAA